MKLIACCLFAVGTLSAQEPAGPVVHEVPLLTCSGLPCVELTSPSVNVLRLVIDLASVNAYLDTKAARSRSLKLEPLKGSSGSDIADVQQTVIPGARIGDLPLGDFPFMVLDTTEDAKQPGKKKEDAYFPADGALAFGSFKNRRIQIDWNRHVLRISEPITDPLPCPRDCGDLIIRHFGQYGPVTLTATGFEIERQTVTAQLDTFFTGTMLIYPDSVEKLG